MLHPLSKSEESYFNFLEVNGLPIREIAHEQKCLRQGRFGPTTYSKVMTSDQPPTVEQISEFIEPSSFRNPLVRTLINALGQQPKLSTRFITTRSILENADRVNGIKPLKLAIPDDDELEENELPARIIPGNHGLLASLLGKATSEKIIKPSILRVENSWHGDDVFPAVKQAERITIPNYSSHKDFRICLALGLKRSPSLYASPFSRLEPGEQKIIHDLFKADGHEKVLNIYMQLGQFYLDAVKRRDQIDMAFDFIEEVDIPDLDEIMNDKIKQLNSLILKDLSK
jgi:hypothetical protein